MARKKRIQRQVRFSLNISNPDELWLYEQIEELKHSRQFRPTIVAALAQYLTGTTTAPVSPRPTHHLQVQEITASQEELDANLLENIDGLFGE